MTEMIGEEDDDLRSRLLEERSSLFEEMMSVPPAVKQAMINHEKQAIELSNSIETKIQQAEELKKNLRKTWQPNERESFLEVSGFEGYNSLQFFCSLGLSLENALRPALFSMTFINAISKHLTGAQEQNTKELKAKIPVLQKVSKEAFEIIEKSVLPFEDIVKQVYKRAIDQYRYLQKRFLNIGIDNTRAYKVPWEREDHGFDFNRIPYVKTELIDNNPLLTDLLLDIAGNLPRKYSRNVRIKGKRKPQEIKYADEFEMERASRILVELSDRTYQGYVKQPGKFLEKIAGSINMYYEILAPMERHIREYLRNTVQVFEAGGKDFDTPIANPAPLTSRIMSINYMGVQPSEEDAKPSGQVERNFFAARKKLLEHLKKSLEIISADENPNNKQIAARAAIEEAMKLREKAEKIILTKRETSLRKDKDNENEFYVGTSGEMGQFRFEREPAPKVKLKDVYGKSFAEMKRHLEDLADYSKYLQLYGATAPRGKIRSNIIAIGPYGCGKTEIGRAIAADPRFIGADVTVTDLLTCWFGEFEKNVDRVWDAAKELRARSGDSKLVFLLLDEFDSWFSASNGHWVDHTYRRVQKAIQMKLDGVVDYEGIITVGFTNEPARIPLAIYRRFKYVDVVGELEQQERVDLMKHFLTTGLPLSSGFRDKHYARWGEMLEGATGDVIGKVVDDIHYEFMRKFISEHPAEGKKLNNRIRRASLNGGKLDKAHVKGAVGKYLKVTPDWVEQKVVAKLNDPIIREQIDTSVRVYAEARQILANLHKREDAASGCVAPQTDIKYRNGVQI